MQALGQWLIDQCHGPIPAITRLSRRLYKIDGDASWDLLQDLLTSLVEGELSPNQIDWVRDIRVALRT